MSQITITDARGVGIPYVPVRFAVGQGGSDGAIYDNLSKVDGSQGWPIPHWPVRDYTLHVNTGDFRDPRFASAVRYIPAPANQDYANEAFVLEAVSGTVPQTDQTVPVLHRDGNDLKDPSGRIVRLEGATFFAALWLLLERGRDAIVPSVRQLVDRYQVNCLVTFGMSVNVQNNLFGAPGFDPGRYGAGFFDAVEELFAIYAEQGCYGYYVVFPDHGLIPAFDQEGKCVDHWNPLLARLQRIPNVILKPTNEGASKGYNYINPHALAFPTFCPVAACDYGVDDPAWATGDFPAGHDWGGDRAFGDLHPPREGSGMYLDCAAVGNIYYKHQQGVAISEAIRLGSNGSRGVTREVARLVGLASRVGTLMRVFHSLQGEKCELFDDITRDHADAYFTGA